MTKSNGLLTEEFLNNYGDFPEHMNELGKFVYYRTYSRFLPEHGRRETWKETVKRASEYNVGLGVKHIDKIGYEVDYGKYRKEAEEFFDSMFNLRQFLSGRTLWVGGADGGVADKYPLSNFNCFTRDTEFITDQGVKSFEDFEDGDKVNVLSKTGGWKEASVRQFGKSEIYELKVRKGKRVETIQTTGNHRWFVDKGGKWDTKVTSELQMGDRFRRKQRYEKTSVTPCPIGITHGIVFGDGTFDKRLGNTRIHLCNDKRDLKDYVLGGNVIEYEKDNQTIITGLPHFMKQLPKDCNIEYRLGFLIGLIATDGNVSRNNTTISASEFEVIKYVRDSAILLGIEPGAIQEIVREGFGKVSTIYSINLAAADLKEEYILRTAHKKEFRETDRKFDYKVESVSKTGRYEDVWCVQEPETESFTLANGILTYNCSFLNIESWEDFGDMFYLLMVGTGVGFKSTKESAANMKPIRKDVEITHETFTQRYPLVKEPNTNLYVINDGEKAVIHIGDSKEGWVEAIRIFFRILTEEEYANVKQIGIFYDYIRPKGAKLRTFGGSASGYEPLKEMFEGIEKVINNEIDPSLAPLETVGENKVMLRPVHVLDIGNLIGNNVVVGGVRRTAEIFLFDEDDYESMFAKYGINGIWDVDRHEKIVGMVEELGRNDIANMLASLPTNDPDARPLHHRRMSNNSVWFQAKPERKVLNLIFEMMQSEGEPGLGNAAEAMRRRPNAKGVNPCFEILLDSYGVCNLTTVNLMQFVRESDSGEFKLDIDGLVEAQKMSARAGLRMTLTELEIPHWNAVQQRDRLIGTSLTGVKDALDLLGYSADEETRLLKLLGDVSREEADLYAKELRVSAPLLATTVKPEGTISQVANGVSSGLHHSHAPYYIRRIRINSNDPLALAVKDLGWDVHAEVGTKGNTEEERLANARTLVIDFPVKSGAKRTKDDVSAKEQLDTYFAFQDNYTEHNSSITVSVRPNEWEGVEETVYDNWDKFVGVSFLAEGGGSYELAPYEAISEERYNEMKSKMAEFSPDVLLQYETGEESDLDGMDGCEGGVCPIR